MKGSVWILRRGGPTHNTGVTGTSSRAVHCATTTDSHTSHTMASENSCVRYCAFIRYCNNNIGALKVRAQGFLRSAQVALAGHFCGGGKKGLVYNLFAHARYSQENRIRVDIFRVLARSLPLYSRICTTDDDSASCLRMLLPIVSEQTLYKTRVDGLCTCTYVAMLHVHIVRD